MTQTLEPYGFSKGESNAYFVLAKLGTATAPAIAKKAKLSPKATAVALGLLAEKGLVVHNQSRRSATFTALDPKHLLAYLDTRAQEAQAARDRAAKSLDSLRADLVRAQPMPRVQYFTGPDGARAALEETLSSKEKTLRAFLSVSDLTDFLSPDFLDRYTNRRIAAGLTLHAVRTFERDKRSARKAKHSKYYNTNREERREVRYVNDDLAFPMTTYLFENKVLLIGSKAENFAVLYESRELSEMQKRLFLMIWRSLSIREIASGQHPG